MENFKSELFGGIFISSYIAWMIWSIIGQVLATLVRNHLTSLKSYPINSVQLLTGFLLVLVFIRFSLELTGLIPTAFGAFAIGLGGNELALALLKKYLNRKKEDNENNDIKIQGIGGSNPPPSKDEK